MRTVDISQDALSIDAPSFAPAAKLSTIKDRLARVGVIDVGSNSVRLVVFDGAARSPAYFYNEKVLCGLGRDLRETGRLHVAGRASALAAIQRFVELAENMKLTVLSAVATAAVREAIDGPEFVEEVLRTTKLPLRVATGQEEAKLSAQGVLLGWPEAEGLVCDIGGSSMELARIAKRKIIAAETSPLGPLTLQSVPEDQLDDHIRMEVEKLAARVPGESDRLYLVGGSWRALSRVDMSRRDYPLHVLHEYQMTPERIIETCRWIRTQSPGQLSQIQDVSSARMVLAPMASRVLEPLIEVLNPSMVAVSSYGLREGVLYAHMTNSIRRLDPLIEAARNMEAASARFPGFGDALYRWIRPLYAEAPRSEKRLIRAACLMHDVHWRAHPDYRAEVCFESVTRANLGGITHPERVFLGFALLGRYRAASKVALAENALSLLSEEEVRKATILGRAMRLGAMMSGGVKELLDKSRLSSEGGTVVLNLSEQARAHAAEVVEKRLASLAEALSQSYRFEIAD